MRVIIKPMGLVVIIVAAISLIVLPRLFPGRTSTEKTTVLSAANPPDQKSDVVNGISGNLVKASDWEFYHDPGAGAEQHAVSVTEPALQNACHFDVTQLGQHPWSIGYHNRIKTALHAHSKVHVTFWARCDRQREVTLVLQHTIEPYAVEWERPIGVTTTWKQYAFDSESQEHSAGEMYLTFFLGQATGSIELADINFTVL